MIGDDIIEIDMDDDPDPFEKEDIFRREMLANAIRRWIGYGITHEIIKENIIPMVKEVSLHEREQLKDDEKAAYRIVLKQNGR